MLISIIILLITFIGMILLIALDKFDRAILSLGAGLICFFILIFIENAKYDVILGYLIGKPEDGFDNFHAIILIIGMMIIVQISVEGGVFQFLAFRLIQMTKGNSKLLLIVFVILATFLTAILNDILTVFILVPLSVTVSKILNIDPRPYIICEAVMLKLGASMFLISAIPNILVSGLLDISFSEFFLRIGIMPIVIFIISLFIFLAFTSTKLKQPRRGVEILLEFNVWNFVPDRSLMMKCVIVLSSVMISFIAIPSTIAGPDVIAFTGAIVLMALSKLDIEDLFKRLDFKLIVYLLGVFLITGGLEYVGVITYIGTFISKITTDNLLYTFLIAMWFAALCSAAIDNIPITKILIPTINILTAGFPRADRVFVFGGMIYGVNWGDNLTPFGDTLLTVQVAETNKCPFKLSEFFKIGFPTAIIQFSIVSIIYCLTMGSPLLSILFVGIAIGVFLLFLWINTDKRFSFKPYIEKLKKKINQLRQKK